MDRASQTRTTQYVDCSLASSPKHFQAIVECEKYITPLLFYLIKLSMGMPVVRLASVACCRHRSVLCVYCRGALPNVWSTVPIVRSPLQAGRASPRAPIGSIAAHVLRQITDMMSSGPHVIIELLHLPNAYGALGPYIKDSGGALLSIASSSLSRRTNSFIFNNHPA
jgi:hypothetical protein